jgi:hypothetical protein
LSGASASSYRCAPIRVIVPASLRGGGHPDARDVGVASDMHGRILAK